MTKWIKRGNANSVRTYLLEIGIDPIKLTNAQETPPEWLGGMTDVAKHIAGAIVNNEHITVFGDYDADGECATAILWLLLEALGTNMRNVTIRLPKRFSEGYGINEKAIDEFHKGLIICIDNGIAAHDAIQKAIDNGFKVVVLDHHLAPEGELIKAHAIVDQHSEILRNNIDKNFIPGRRQISDPSEAFIDYCGAGLALKLAQYMLPNNEETEILLDKMTAIAAIATVADSVSLVGENRIIVKKGLALINKALKGEKDKVTLGLLSILKELGVKEMRDEDIAFKLAPIMNAPARLNDDGARLPCAAICQDKKEIPHIAQELIELNTLRKSMQVDAIKRAEELITEISAPIIVFDPEGSKGLIGIVAGQLAEQYKLPAVVFALSEDQTTWDGSMRTYGSIHIKDCLDKVSDTLKRYGGHAGAAGLGIAVGDEVKFATAIKEVMKDIQPADESGNNISYYDLDITIDEVPGILAQMNEYGPFGQDVPAPVIRISGVKAANGYGGKYGFLMGAMNQHIKFEATQKTRPGERKTKIILLGFNLAEKYLEMGGPQIFDVVGTLGYKNDNYGKAIQLNMVDFC